MHVVSIIPVGHNKVKIDKKEMLNFVDSDGFRKCNDINLLRIDENIIILKE